jgi:hypothetical protein
MLDFVFYKTIDTEIDALGKVYKDNEHLKKQNDTGKKSFLFLFWFLKRYLPNHDPLTLDSYVTEGNDDSSCDLIFDNKDQLGNSVFYVVQAKWFAENNIGKYKGGETDIKSCITDFRTILDGTKKSTNEKFNSQYQRLIEHKKKNGKIKFIFLMLVNKDVDVQEYIKDFKPPLLTFEIYNLFKLKQEYVDLEYKGVKTHNPLDTPYEPKAEITINFEENKVIKVDSPFLSYIFLIKPKQVYELFNKYGQALFYKNIRNPL